MNRDRIVQRFVGPARIARDVDVGLSDGRGVRVRLLDEPVKGTIFLGDRCGLEVVQYRLNELSIAEQLRRDRGVGANSERTIVEPRRQRRDQLALSGRKGRRPTHDLLRETREMVGALRLESEQMQDLRDGYPCGAHLRESFTAFPGR